MLIEDYVNLKQYPSKDKINVITDDEPTQLTIGDLHGNALKLMYFLIRQGVIEFDEKDYDDFVKLYFKDVNQLTAEDLKYYNDLMGRIKVTDKPVTVRLIGDEFADRGSNDFFTLKILEQLNQKKLNMEILLSNHGIEFIGVYERGFQLIPQNLRAEFNTKPYSNTVTTLLTGFHHNDQDISLQRMGVLIEKGLVTVEEINRMIENDYLPNVMPLSYSFAKPLNEEPNFTFYRHATVGLEIIHGFISEMPDYLSSMVKELESDPRLKTHKTIETILMDLNKFIADFEKNIPISPINEWNIDEMTKVIDKINEGFSYLTQLNAIYSSYFEEKDKKKAVDTAIALNQPLYRVTWLRKYFQSILIEKQGDHKMHDVDGHDGAQNAHTPAVVPAGKEHFVTCLDNFLGKGAANNEGYYSVEFSHEYSAKLEWKKRPLPWNKLMLSWTQEIQERIENNYKITIPAPIISADESIWTSPVSSSQQTTQNQDSEKKEVTPLKSKEEDHQVSSVASVSEDKKQDIPLRKYVVEANGAFRAWQEEIDWFEMSIKKNIETNHLENITVDNITKRCESFNDMHSKLSHYKDFLANDKLKGYLENDETEKFQQKREGKAKEVSDTLDRLENNLKILTEVKIKIEKKEPFVEVLSSLNSRPKKN